MKPTKSAKSLRIMSRFFVIVVCFCMLALALTSTAQAAGVTHGATNDHSYIPMVPIIHISPPTGPFNTHVHVYGCGFSANDATVKVKVAGILVWTGPMINGCFKSSFTMPHDPNTNCGNAIVKAKGFPALDSATTNFLYVNPC